MSVLTREGYLVHVDDLTESDIDELTVTPGVFHPDDVPRTFEVFLDNDDGTVAVPRYWGENKFGRVRGFSGDVHEAKNLIFEGVLRSKCQIRAAELSVKQLREVGGGVLCAMTGFGKTTVALYVACVLKIKTLIVVHKQFLMDQWIERIKQFVPSADVGKLRQKVIEVEDKDIVVGMLQSIAMRTYNSEVFDGFGLVIFDEVHVVPAPVFSRALFKSCAPCILGLSATPERKDGMSYVIHWFVGPIFMELRLAGRAEIEVRVVHVQCKLKVNMSSRYAMATVANKLCDDPERNTLLVRVIKNLVATGRKVIVLSDRRAHCKVLNGILGDSSGLYFGGMKVHELRESEAKDILLCTYSYASEGLDIPGLDALVLATPRSNVVQACGRILHGKSPNPVIVDVIDDWFLGVAQFQKRKKYYDEAGFTISCAAEATRVIGALCI
jgi:superfamily II DNA or RNA helicase